MADEVIKISELDPASALDGTELLVMVKDGVTVRATAQEVADFKNGQNTIYVDRCATTNQVLSGEPSSGIDEAGSTLLAGTTILLRYQTDKRENGVWTISVGAWSRISGYDTYATLKGLSIIVRNGDTLAGTEWKVVTDTFSVGVDEITINELTNVTAGTPKKITDSGIISIITDSANYNDAFGNVSPALGGVWNLSTPMPSVGENDYYIEPIGTPDGLPRHKIEAKKNSSGILTLIRIPYIQ